MVQFTTNPAAGTPCDLEAFLRPTLQISSHGATSYTRKRPTWKPTRTVCQGQRRVQFKRVTNAWLALTAGQRLAWKDLAQITPFLGKCSQVVFLSARRLFIKVNAILIEFGDDAMLSDPPGAYTPPGTPVSLAFDTANFCFYPTPIAISTHTMPGGTGVIVYAYPGRLLSSGELLKKGRIIFATTQDKDPIYGPDLDNPNLDSTRLLWQIATRIGWLKIDKAYGGLCKIQGLTGNQ